MGEVARESPSHLRLIGVRDRTKRGRDRFRFGGSTFRGVVEGRGNASAAWLGGSRTATGDRQKIRRRGPTAEGPARSAGGIKAVNPTALTPQIDQAFTFGLYNRALHPEFFDLRTRRVARHQGWELESWIVAGGHVLRFGTGSACYAEAICQTETPLPDTHSVAGFVCGGEHDLDESFDADGVGYISTIQTEALGDNLYRATFEEMLDYAGEADAQMCRWETPEGSNLSIIDVQRFHKEVHAQCYHLYARGGVVLRTQTIFEQK